MERVPAPPPAPPPPPAAVPLPVQVLPHAEGLPLPARATPGSAGLDLVAAVGGPLTIPPGGRALVPTGLRLAIPEGYEVQLRPRSGLALKHGITLPNAPATIDSDYRGELQVILMNLGAEPFTVERGMRVAQLLLQPVTPVALTPVAALDATGRGSGGFGSTGA